MLSTHHAIDLERGNHNARGYQEVVLKAMAFCLATAPHRSKAVA